MVDEYQDFSQLFFAMVMAIRSVVTEAKLFVVGDDWQAINRFAGSDVGYFKEFEKMFESARRYEITTNYRCDREIVGAARKFMKRAMKETGNFRASSRRSGKVLVVDPMETEVEFAMTEYDPRVSGRDYIYYNMTRRMLRKAPSVATVRYVKTVVELVRENVRAESIMLLHRNNEMNLDGMRLSGLANGLRWGLDKMGVMKSSEFNKKVRVMTMHKSKGLEAEVVIIMEADEGVIPKVYSDAGLYAIFGETDEATLEDQKRLFYVAMTRAKKRLYIIHDDMCGEGFMKFLKNLQKRC